MIISFVAGPFYFENTTQIFSFFYVYASLKVIFFIACSSFWPNFTGSSILSTQWNHTI